MTSPERNRLKAKTYRDRMYKQRRCPICGKETDAFYCDYHRMKHNEYSKALRKRRKEKGNCTRCSAPLNPDADANHTNCINCQERVTFL